MTCALSYLPENPGQVRIDYTECQICVCKRESSFNPNSNTLESGRQQCDRLAPSVVAQ